MPRPSYQLRLTAPRPTVPRLPSTEGSTRISTSGCAISSWRSTGRCSRSSREWRSCWSSPRGRSRSLG
nr:unnamed protein product [Callosobruchus chinensis]